jgi:hypothetical protein
VIEAAAGEGGPGRAGGLAGPAAQGFQEAVGVIVIGSFFDSAGTGMVISTTPSLVFALILEASILSLAPHRGSSHHAIRVIRVRVHAKWVTTAHPACAHAEWHEIESFAPARTIRGDEAIGGLR